MTKPTPSSKPKYRLQNWPEYERALIQRGSLTVWFAPEVAQQWYEPPKGRRGASRLYSDTAIQCVLTLQAVFSLPLRAAQGLAQSLVQLMDLDLEVPDHTTLSRRRQGMTVKISRPYRGQALHVVIDSTGLKVYGEGEWKVRQHGQGRRRVWRKLHLALDAESQDIVAALVTTSNVHDANVLEDLLEQVDEVLKQVSADGAYDTRDCHRALLGRGATGAIPPRQGAAPWPALEDGQTHPRTSILQAIERVGRGQWKKDSHYHRRSLAETAMFRFKTLLGDRLTARSFEGQVNESYVRCAALNRMTGLGMPVTETIHG